MAARPSRLVDQVVGAIRKIIPEANNSKARSTAIEVLQAIKRSHKITGKKDFQEQMANAVLRMRSTLRLLCKSCKRNMVDWE